MKHLAIALGLLVVPGLMAQEQERPAPVPQQKQAEKTSPAAPKLGHPLDPADVDVLTGKKARAYSESRREVNPYGPYGQPDLWGYGYYGYGSWRANRSIAADVTTETSPPFSLIFPGRFGSRPVVVFGDARPLLFGRLQPVWCNRLFSPVRLLPRR